MTQGESRKRQAGEVGLTILVVLLLHGLFWAFSDLDWNSPNPYNSYSKQCVAWLQGRLDLGQDHVDLWTNCRQALEEAILRFLQPQSYAKTLARLGDSW